MPDDRPPLDSFRGFTIRLRPSEEDAAEEPAAERSLLRELADDPDSHLTELSPGVWWQAKLRPDRDKLS